MKPSYLPASDVIMAIRYAKAKTARATAMKQAAQIDMGVIDVKEFNVSKMVLQAMFAAMDALQYTAYDKVIFKEKS